MTEKPIRIDSERRIVMQSPVTREGVPPNSATHDAREVDSRYGDDDMGRLRGQTARPIRALQARGLIPVLAPLGIGADALTYNNIIPRPWRIRSVRARERRTRA